MATSPLVENNLFDKSFINKAHNQHLSLQLSTTQLKLAWFDIPSKTYFAFQQLDLSTIADLEVFLKGLNTIDKPFQSTSLSLVNNLYTLVPKGLFQEDKESTYLHFNQGYIDSELNSELIESHNTVLVYALSNPYLSSLKHAFPGIKTNHFAKILVNALSLEKTDNDENLFIHIQDKRFDVCYIKSQKLHFFNSFEYKTTEDFIYFLLYVMEQLTLNRETCPIKLCGEFVETSSIYETIFKYIRNVELLKRPNHANYSIVLNSIPEQYHYSLFNQYLCE